MRKKAKKGSATRVVGLVIEDRTRPAPGFHETSSGCEGGGVCFTRNRESFLSIEETWDHYDAEKRAASSSGRLQGK